MKLEAKQKRGAFKVESTVKSTREEKILAQYGNHSNFSIGVKLLVAEDLTLNV